MKWSVDTAVREGVALCGYLKRAGPNTALVKNLTNEYYQNVFRLTATL